jgi:Mn-containing catalase
MHEFGYLLDPEPLGGPGSAPAPDPKLYATYDGKQCEPSGPALGTETGLAGKIKDASPDRLAEASRDVYGARTA